MYGAGIIVEEKKRASNIYLTKKITVRWHFTLGISAVGKFWRVFKPIIQFQKNQKRGLDPFRRGGYENKWLVKLYICQPTGMHRRLDYMNGAHHPEIMDRSELDDCDVPPRDGMCPESDSHDGMTVTLTVSSGS